ERAWGWVNGARGGGSGDGASASGGMARFGRYCWRAAAASVLWNGVLRVSTRLWHTMHCTPLLPDAVLRSCASTVANASPVALSDVGLNPGSRRPCSSPLGSSRSTFSSGTLSTELGGMWQPARVAAVGRRPGAGDPLRAIAKIEPGGARRGVGERIVRGLGRAARRRRDLAVAARGHRARRQQDRGAPRRIAPRVRHHRAVPLVENARVAVVALTRVVGVLPVLLERRCGGAGVS